MRRAEKTSTFRIGVICTLAVTSAVAVDVGCGGDDSSMNGTTPEAGTTDDAQQVGADVVVPTDSAVTGPQTVTFAYQPQWAGATKVEVVGGFGQASDWSKTGAFVTLTASTNGLFTGTATLPAGSYPYVFRVTGDSASSTPSTYQRYAVDPSDPSFVPCPMQSPTYSKIDANPCSQLAVPASSAAPTVHVKGSLSADGAPASGWLVVLERDEASSHHFFANRATTGSDGSFDLIATAGSYRLQAQHPTYLNETDLERSPAALNALRRAISSTIPLTTSDVTISAPDLAFHDYAAFAPTGNGGALPTQFTFKPGAGTRLDVYGSGSDGGVTEIGDPWFSSGPTNDGGALFVGTFNTKQAEQDAAVPGRRYMWGTEEPADAGIPWTKQTMVYPIVWQ